jgi:type II secretory pathway component PulF
MFRSLYISRSLQTMGQLINAGVPMLDTLAITGDISGNQLFQGHVEARPHVASSRARRSPAPPQGASAPPRRGRR